jgi:hypothetical protein
MNESIPPSNAPPKAEPPKPARKLSEEERLKAALRDNLKRRKEAARKQDLP